MADHASRGDGDSSTVSPSLHAQLAPLLDSLASCEPAASDDLLLFFHSSIDAAIGHAHSFAAFSPALASKATASIRLITLLASTITPTRSPCYHLRQPPLPSTDRCLVPTVPRSVHAARCAAHGRSATPPPPSARPTSTRLTTASVSSPHHHILPASISPPPCSACTAATREGTEQRRGTV